MMTSPFSPATCSALARKAGIERELTEEEFSTLRSAVDSFVGRILWAAVAFAEHGRRHALGTQDVLRAAVHHPIFASLLSLATSSPEINWLREHRALRLAPQLLIPPQTPSGRATVRHWRSANLCGVGAALHAVLEAPMHGAQRRLLARALARAGAATALLPSPSRVAAAAAAAIASATAPSEPRLDDELPGSEGDDDDVDEDV